MSQNSLVSRHWDTLLKPYKIAVEHRQDQRRFAVMTFEPLERGFGLTLGNALRRVLLSSLQGFAVTQIRIDGVQHEFSTLPGMREDITDLILNLKKLDLGLMGETQRKIHLAAEGPCVVTAGMMAKAGNIDVLTPDQVVCHLDVGAKIMMDVTVEMGRGYVPASQHKNEQMPIGVILLDAMFSPVRNVIYQVENVRAGHMMHADKLILTVETNGSVTPEEAVVLAARILQDQLQKFLSFDTSLAEKGNIFATDDKTTPVPSILLKKIDDLELTNRARNCLEQFNIIFVGDLVQLKEAELLRRPNFGRKSLQEIQKALSQHNLSLGMVVEGWPPETLDHHFS